jgi:hypothetical protein
MGVDIRREKSEPSTNIAWKLTLHGIITLLLSFVYIGMAGYVAVERGIGADLTGFLESIVGQPPHTSNQPCILMFAFGHWVMIFLANMVIHQNLQSGGWLRGRLDQMRNPPVQRGELGSSHFCTHRLAIAHSADDTPCTSLPRAVFDLTSSISNFSDFVIQIRWHLPAQKSGWTIQCSQPS